LHARTRALNAFSWRDIKASFTSRVREMMHHAAKNGAIQRPREPLGFPSGVRCTHDPRIRKSRESSSLIDDIPSAACYDTIIKAEEEEREEEVEKEKKEKEETARIQLTLAENNRDYLRSPIARERRRTSPGEFAVEPDDGMRAR